MTDINKITNSDLFTDLSEKEQEIISGGVDFYIQKRDIFSSANSEDSLSYGSLGFSSKQNSTYKVSELTIGFNLDSMLGQGSINRIRKYGFSPLDYIYRLVWYLFR